MAEPREQPQRVIREVAVLPISDFARGPESLWEGAGGEPGALASQIESYLVRRLSLEPRVRIVGPADVVARTQRTRAHVDSVSLGLDHVKLGLSLYRELRVEDAIPNLERAYVLLKDAYQDVVSPKALADVARTLALCHLERKDHHRAHLLLKEMFYWTPEARFQRGFYAPVFEEALTRSLLDFVATYPRDTPLLSTARLEKFAQDIDVDAVVYARLEPPRSGQTGRRIRIQVFDRHTRTVTFRGALVATGSPDDFERIDRFVTRWTTCLPEQIVPEDKPPERKVRVFVDTSAIHSVFVKHTTRRYFHNVGMSLNAEVQFTSSLGVFFQVSMLSSTQDPDRDLLDNFTFVRLSTGLSFSLRGSWWRLYVRLGVLDVQILGSYATTTDPNCKWYGESHTRCTDVIHLGDESTFGFNAAVGTQFLLPRDLYINVRFGYSVYAFPNNKSISLNHPISTELGLGYAF